MSLFNRLLTNALCLYGSKVFEGLLQLALLAFILSQVGREYYAAALLIASIQASIDLARGGMQKATLKYIAQYKAIGDTGGANGVLSSSTAMQGAVGLLGLAACLVIAPHGTTIFSLPDYMRTEAQMSTVLLGVGIALSFAISPWRNSVAAQERYDLLSLASVLGKVLRAVLVVALLLMKAPSLISLVLATMAGGIAERGVCIVFVKRLSPGMRFSARSISMRYIKLMLGFSLFDFMHTLAGLLYSQGSFLIAAHLISLEAVAGLGIIGNITSLLGLATSQIGQMLVPTASRLNAQGNRQTLKHLVVRGTTITVFAGGCVMAGVVPWMESLLRVWLGASFSGLVSPAVVLMVATFIMTSLTCIHNPLAGVGRVAVDGICNAFCTALGLAIGALLVWWTELALLGLVFGLLFARVLRWVFITWYGSVIFKLPLGDFLRRSYVGSCLLSGAVCLAGSSSGVVWHSWFSLLLAGMLTASVFLLAGVFWIVPASDRQRFMDSIAFAKASIRGWTRTTASRT